MSSSVEERSAIEQCIREHVAAEAHQRAASFAIESYGPELLRYIAAIVKEEDAASEVFSQMCEDIWCGIREMRWQSSFRTWCYAVARNACFRHLRSPSRRRLLALSEARELETLCASVRTRTLPYLRSEVKDAVARLRETLTPDEQGLLTLRVDRALDWNEIAEILAEQPLDAASLRRNAAACRKRFERLTDKLRALALREGLIDADE